MLTMAIKAMQKEVVLISGSSSGIGKATALLLLSKGYTVYAFARRMDRMADLEAQGARVFQADIRDESALQNILDTIRQEQGRLDALVNNAGMTIYCTMEETPDEWARQLFECVHSHEVAASLVETACAWLRDNGMDKVTGPINLSTANESGLLIEGFDRPPVIQMTYNPPYYLSLLEDAGLNKEIDLLAFYTTDEIVTKKGLIQKLERISDRVIQAEHIHFRSFDPKHYDRDLELIRQLYNDFMQDNWGFVPLEQDEFTFSAGLLKPLLVRELALFAEVNGQTVGFSLAVPDVNQTLIKLNGRLFPFGVFKFLWYKRKITDIRVMLMGISAAYRRKGLEAVFYLKTIKDGYYKKGFTGAEMSWVTETNPDMIAALAKLETRVYKKYRMFSKRLG